MNICIGVVGPEDSVQLICDTASDFETIQVIPCAYADINEVPDIINEHKNKVDQWLFSGQAPYALSLEKRLVKEESAWQVPLHGSSLLGTFLEAFTKMNSTFHSISLDTISQTYSDWLIKRFSLSQLTINTYSYMGYVTVEELIDFHTTCYKTGESSVAFTCIRAVYEALRQQGIPCYRITPSSPDIRETIVRIQERAQFRYYRNAQLAIIGVEVSDTANSRKDDMNSYRLKHQELVLRKLLLEYAESVQGSFIEQGHGHFSIYTTRGEIEALGWPFDLVKEAKHVAKLDLSIGIGYGQTAIGAESHVQMALQIAQQHGQEVIVLVNEEKQVTEAFEQEEPLLYEQVQFKNEHSKSALSPAMLSRIFAKAHQQQKRFLTAQELSQWIQSTERHARRILSELERSGYIKQTAEEQSGHRGRPRRVYEIIK